MQATPHRLPLLVSSGEDKSERETEKGTLETDYVSEIFDRRKGKSRIILGEDYRLWEEELTFRRERIYIILIVS